MTFIKGARTWMSILGTQTFFWPLTHPPTHPRYSTNQPHGGGGGGGWGVLHTRTGPGRPPREARPPGSHLNTVILPLPRV